MNDGVMLSVAFVLAAFAAMLGALALTVSITGRAGQQETVLVASITWVPPSEIPRLEEEYWDRNIVPLCVDLPTIQNFGVEAEPVACFLEVAK